MKPWEKEIRAKEVVAWMYEENPEIWYTPASVTDQNPPYPHSKLTIEDATAVFEELGSRELIRRIYPVVHVGDGNQREDIQIPAWETDKSKTGEIWTFLHSGWFRVYIVSTFRFLWLNRGRAVILILSALGIFITGFLTQAGQDAWTLVSGWLGWPRTT